MGTCIRNLSDGAVLVAADDTWIEGKAIQQLETTARLGACIGWPACRTCIRDVAIRSARHSFRGAFVPGAGRQ